MSKLNGVCWNAATPQPADLSSGVQQCSTRNTRRTCNNTPSKPPRLRPLRIYIGYKTRQYFSPQEAPHADHHCTAITQDLSLRGKSRKREEQETPPKPLAPFLTSDKMRNPFVARPNPDSPDMFELFEMMPYPCRGPLALRQAPRDLRPRLISTSSLTLALATLSPDDDDKDDDDDQKARDIRAWRSGTKATETPGSVRQESCNSANRRPLGDSTVPLLRRRSPSVTSSSSSASEGSISSRTPSRPPAARRTKDCAILWRQYWD